MMSKRPVRQISPEWLKKRNSEYAPIPPKKQKNRKPPKRKRAVSAVLSALLLYISMGQMLTDKLPVPPFMNISGDPYGFALTQLLLCIPVMFIGRRFFTHGIPLLLRGNPNMDSLVAVGAGASFIYSVVMTYMIPYNMHAVHNLYYESVAVVITLVALGKQLEEHSKRRTASAVEKLMRLSPDTARVLRDGKEITVSTKDVAVGETVIVKPGESIPLDGKIIKGESSADESMLTGESLPIEKTEGSLVTGGSINISGVICPHPRLMSSAEIVLLYSFGKLSKKSSPFCVNTNPVSNGLPGSMQ